MSAGSGMDPNPVVADGVPRMGRFAGVNAVVVGASSGIGLACADLFASEGARVVMMARDRARLADAAESVAAQCRTRAQVCVEEVDVRDERSVKTALENAAGENRLIDILVCSAGVSGLLGRDLSDVSVDEWDRLIDTNLRGQWLLVKHAREYLRNARPSSVVMLASDSAFVASPNHVPYCASKGGVVSLVRALSVDLWPQGIRVNCVCPSIVDTQLARKSQGADESGFDSAAYPVHDPSDIAECVAFLASPSARSINGHALMADFGYSVRSNFPG